MEEAGAENAASLRCERPVLSVLSELSVLRPLLRFGVMERAEERFEGWLAPRFPP